MEPTLFRTAVWIGFGTVLGACSRGEHAPPLDPELAAVGRQVYVESCASCHGCEGEGAPNWQVRNELGELPPPPHDTEGYTWMHSDSVLYHTVSEGRADDLQCFGQANDACFQGCSFAERNSPCDLGRATRRTGAGGDAGARAWGGRAGMSEALPAVVWAPDEAGG